RARGRGVATIGLLIGAVDDPFYARLTSGVEQVARAHRHTVLVSPTEEDAGLERNAALSLAARQVDGVIMVPCAPDQGYLAPDVAAGLAVVFVDRPPHGLDADCVLSDNRAGAQDGTARLLAAGYRRIAFVGNDTSVYTSAERLAGFLAAHAELGLAVHEELVALGPRTVAEAEAAARALLDSAEPPQAIFAQNGLTTMGVWRAVHALGRPVGLVGFDDFALADVLQPPVDVVAQDPVELGRQSAQLLFDRLADPGRPVRRTVLPTHLVTRNAPRP
ncbi:MAG: substrate-binding domain-containing protein, partial [Actinobacteria bacterium]|nr:substrate-binding domain-containing protein [Actinomycetota bacterium]